MFAFLKNRSVIKLVGEESKLFVQNYFTNDVKLLKPNSAIFGAFLDKKGHVFCESILYEKGNELLIEHATSRSSKLIKYINFYKLKTKLQVDDIKSSHKVYYTLQNNDNSDKESIIFKDPRHESLKYHCITPKEVNIENNSNEILNHYNYNRLMNAIAEGDEMNSYYPLECNLDQLSGISFNKGCYLGQEKVSYMQSRNLIIRRIKTFKCDDSFKSDNQSNLTITSNEWTDDTPLGTILEYNESLNLGICSIKLKALKECSIFGWNNNKIEILN